MPAVTQMRDRPNENIRPFLGMHPTQENKPPDALQCRMFLQKIRRVVPTGIRRARRAIADHDLVAVIEPERISRQHSLLFAGKKHPRGVTQRRIHRPRPEQPFFKMLQRIAVFKPRIEHTVGVNVIRHVAIPQRLPSTKTVIPPNAVDDHAIVAVHIRLKPRHEPRSIAVVGIRRPRRMHRISELPHPFAGRIIQREQFDLVTERSINPRELPHPLDRPAGRRID